MPESVDRRYNIFKAVMRFGESWASKFTNFGIREAFSTASLATLSKIRL